MRRTTMFAALVASILLAAACSGSGDGDGDSADAGGGDGATAEPSAPAEDEPTEYPTEELLIGFAAPNQVYSAVYVAMDQGFFADEGFDAEVVLTQSSTGAVQQAAAGSVQFAGATPDAAIFGMQQGAPVTIVSSTIKGSPLSVVGGPDVTDWEDLRGQTIGVSALKGGEIALLRQLLSEHGLEEGDDYDVIVSGATPAKAAALSEGSVAAAVLFSPTDYALEAQGFNILGSTAELETADQMPLIVYLVNDDWVGDNDRGERLGRVLVRANEWLQDPANRDEAVEIFAAAADQAPEHVAATYELWFDEFGIGTPDGQVTAEEIRTTLEMMAADGDVPEPLPDPGEFIDPSYIENAIQSGAAN
ncbi:ABC transporter substrate-binding protein [Jiangella mangrovi]|uniref:ABC-type nitrate/sulfonate/bicarbonate transport system substrate-binding protein n=1 Tax=Jiangella mangrovi TaxID=1524084 RepID=A0A7W9GSG5_9ACTN|nr:ABC transporter substrate-binding protein [Jiangella mangrovi]MBB5788993.1 ABC-type nitrate/sulfonate/bicarbonate transport system substrate-binding protein [Jiangella mangrovi]